MTVYVIVDNKVHTPEHYQEYLRLITPTVAEYGGQYKIRAGKVHLFDSDWQPERIVMIEFSTKEAALAWVNAPELQALHAMRRQYAESKMIVIDAYSQPTSTEA
jgi:uncharacterized protein (DUF1330 family)